MYYLHKLLWELRRDASLAARFRTDPDAVLHAYDLDPRDRDAIVARDFRTLYERLRWAHEPFLVGRDFTEFARYNVPLEKIRVNAAGYINVGRCRPPYREGLVPQQHVDGTLAHIDRYKQVLKEVAERFGKKQP